MNPELSMSHIIFRSIAIIIALGTVQTAAAANLAVKVEDWLFVKTEEKGKIQCYAYSIPYRTKLYHSGVERAPFMQIAWHGTSQYTLSINAGYTLDARTPMVIETEQNGSYMLQTAYADTAITYSSTQDSYIIDNLIDMNDYFRVRSMNELGFQAIDYYSLKGFIATMKLMQNNCHNGEIR
jgi:hypothetical protein